MIVVLFFAIAITVASGSNDCGPINVERLVAFADIIVQGQLVDSLTHVPRAHGAATKSRGPRPLASKLRIDCVLKTNTSLSTITRRNHVFVENLNDPGLCTRQMHEGDRATFLLHSCDSNRRLCQLVYQGLQTVNVVREKLNLRANACLTRGREATTTPPTTQPETPTSGPYENSDSECGRTDDPMTWHATIRIAGRAVACDGAVVRSKWILTSGKCLTNAAGVVAMATVKVKVGNASYSVETIRIRHGFALLEIDAAVTTTTTKPLCVMKSSKPPEEGYAKCFLTRTTATGFERNYVYPVVLNRSNCVVSSGKRLLVVATNDVEEEESAEATSPQRGLPLICRVASGRNEKWHQVGMAIKNRYVDADCGGTRGQLFFELVLERHVQNLLVGSS